MAHKRKRTVGKSSYDKTKFVSEAASERHKNSIVNKGKIKERGIHSRRDRVYLPILNRGWQTFAAQPEAAVIA